MESRCWQEFGSNAEAAGAHEGRLAACAVWLGCGRNGQEGETAFLSLHLFLCLPPALQKGFDVFNALDLMENKTFLEKLKFGIGDGNLQYYLYNWKCPSMGAEKVRPCPAQLGSGVVLPAGTGPQV